MRIAIILALVFNLMALVVLIRENPIAFTLFMFLGQPLFAVALILLVGALLAEITDEADHLDRRQARRDDRMATI